MNISTTKNIYIYWKKENLTTLKTFENKIWNILRKIWKTSLTGRIDMFSDIYIYYTILMSSLLMFLLSSSAFRKTVLTIFRQMCGIFSQICIFQSTFHHINKIINFPYYGHKFRLCNIIFSHTIKYSTFL